MGQARRVAGLMTIPALRGNTGPVHMKGLLVSLISGGLVAGMKRLARRPDPILLLCAAAALSACSSDDKGAYAIYNYSGKPVISPVVLSNTGHHAVSRERIPDQSANLFGSVESFKKERSITLEWIAGEGRATWYRATVPVKVEQADGTIIEIYMRPDNFVCANLIGDIRPGTDSENLARAHQDRSMLSCAQPVALPRLAPGMANSLRHHTVTYSQKRYEHGGTDTMTYQTLIHKDKHVALRFEQEYPHGDRTRSIEEFRALDLLGNNAGWLVTADLGNNNIGWFVVSGDSSAWSSRFVGEVHGEQRRLSNDRLYHDANVVVDTRTAEVFMLPKFRNLIYSVLGQSPDGRQLAIFWQKDYRIPQDPALPDFNFGMIDLETGKMMEAQIANLPALPPSQHVIIFYPEWYREHCTWAPLLQCQ